MVGVIGEDADKDGKPDFTYFDSEYFTSGTVAEGSKTLSDEERDYVTTDSSLYRNATYNPESGNLEAYGNFSEPSKGSSSTIGLDGEVNINASSYEGFGTLGETNYNTRHADYGQQVQAGLNNGIRLGEGVYDGVTQTGRATIEGVQFIFGSPGEAAGQIANGVVHAITHPGETIRGVGRELMSSFENLTSSDPNIQGQEIGRIGADIAIGAATDGVGKFIGHAADLAGGGIVAKNLAKNSDELTKAAGGAGGKLDDVANGAGKFRDDVVDGLVELPSKNDNWVN